MSSLFNSKHEIKQHSTYLYKTDQLQFNPISASVEVLVQCYVGGVKDSQADGGHRLAPHLVVRHAHIHPIIIPMDCFCTKITTQMTFMCVIDVCLPICTAGPSINL